MHPSLRKLSHIESEINSIEIFNYKVDKNTIKILIHILPYTRITCLKFGMNDWELSNLELLIDGIVNTQNNIYNLSLDWLKDNIKPEKMYSQLFELSKLEGVSLRGSNIGDLGAKEIFRILKNNKNLKTLNLYENNISDDILEDFNMFLTDNKCLETLNLGNNYFTDSFISGIKNFLGVFHLSSPEEVADYQRKIKERDAIVSKNVKLRNSKKPELEVPFLFPLEQRGNEFFVVKNEKIKNVNLMKNKFTDKACQDIIDILKISW